MQRIHKLPPELVAKIAAGEVIERPAYVVKELLDNAIDAKATTIEIEIEKSGLKSITVRDNGLGMNEKDLRICFLPHTTSKLSSTEDLTHMQTLGFRGEALSSIGAVSNLTIQSKPKNSITGKKVIIKNGDIADISSIGMAIGTNVICQNLFGSYPARKKFLKSERVEFKHIYEVAQNYALSYPSINISLTHNKKEQFRFSYLDKLPQRLSVLLGETVLDNYLPVKHEESYLELEGFIGHPQTAIKGTSKIMLFVNNRRVYDQLIYQAIKDSYGQMLEPHSYPNALLFLKIPFEFVDVNIHPRKEHVSFPDQKFIYDFISKAVETTLTKHNLTFYNLSWKRNTAASSYAAKALREELLREKATFNKNGDVLQIHNLYLIVETKRGFMLIDQHAADEALIYKSLRNKFLKKRSQGSFSLKPGILITLPAVDKILLEDNKKELSKIGFEIEDFGGNTIKVTKVPSLLKDRDPKELISEFISDISEGASPSSIDQKSNIMLSYLACKSAIKQGQKLTKKQIKELTQKLDESDMSYTCPHGRPVKIEVPLNSLHRMFKRH